MAKFPENFATLTLIWLQIYINYTMTTNFLQNILFYNIPLKHFFLFFTYFILINKK